MSVYTEEYLRNKLMEKLGATHVVSFDWKSSIVVCLVSSGSRGKTDTPVNHGKPNLKANYTVQKVKNSL